MSEAPYVLPPTWPGDPSSLTDEVDERALLETELIHAGMVWDLRRDTVDLGDGQTVRREFVQHPGAVGVLALDDHDRVLLIRQYRHPVGMSLWEPVAGLLDVADESPQAGAARELVEEAGLVAARWDVLVDLENSPGGSSETIRCYLARDLAPAPGGRPPGDGEERDLPVAWVPLEEAVLAVLAGRLTAPLTVAATLAALAARSAGWSTLRAADAAWPARERVAGSGRARIYRSS
ncbi:NUDIX domain-containing protein [Longivirga aurantiaca]|uniref:NUDIX domain-containing protein n=1 Tax=Longivirga aurantiaca TaxID=1837743 RepID=A0ABW1T2V4_9ACTN